VESSIDVLRFLTQNDGAVMQAETTIAFPLINLAFRRPTRCAAHLSGLA
jgi:hypothetical protein